MLLDAGSLFEPYIPFMLSEEDLAGSLLGFVAQILAVLVCDLFCLDPGDDIFTG